MRKISLSLLFISILLISGCSNEKEARTMLNQAIQTWDSGELEKAYEMFKKIETDYLDTEAATVSIKEHKERIERYQQSYETENLNRSRGRRSGYVTKQVITAIDSYKTTYQQYPEKLNAIEQPSFYRIDKQEVAGLLEQCEYEKALFEAGYSLNCLEADSAYRIKVSKNRKNSSKNDSYEKENINSPKQLSSYPKTNKTLGAIFNPRDILPSNGFSAYYFNVNNPNQLIFKEQVSDVAISYIYDQFHNISSKEFGAYWVGQLEFDKATVKNIGVDLSWSKARVIIDGHVIYDDKNSSRVIPIVFPAGKHKVEVEYANNWHTTEFAVSIVDKTEQLSNTDINDYFARNLAAIGDFNLYYAGAYESRNKDLTVPLNIQASTKPIVLVLSSYSVIKWQINNPYNVDIKAIIYGSHDKGTEVRNVSATTKLLPTKRLSGSYKLGEICDCKNDGSLQCRYNDGLERSLESLIGHKLNGFSGTYGANSFNIPELVLTDSVKRAMIAESPQKQRRREECKIQQNKNRSFEEMAEEASKRS